MTDKQDDIGVTPNLMRMKLSQMHRTCQTYLLDAFMLGRKFEGTAPDKTERLDKIMHEYDRLRTELQKIKGY